MKTIEITIYLKSGVRFSVIVDDFTVKKNGLGQLVGLEWKNTSEEFPHMLHVDVSEIAAIVSIHQSAQHGVEPTEGTSPVISSESVGGSR